MVTHKQVQVLRRINEFGVRAVRSWEPGEGLLTPEQQAKLELDPHVHYVLGDDSEVPERMMLKLLEKGLLKRDLRNLTEYGKEVIEMADFELGE